MLVARPSGDPWSIEDAAKKLALRGGLPGAFVFDLAASASRNAKAAGLSAEDRLALALPASWLVNSPAVSPVFRRWAEGAQREVWLALLEVLDGDARRWHSTRSTSEDEELTLAVRALGSEPYVIEAASKVLAVLVPDVVPLMPGPARDFVLGAASASEVTSFAAMVDWFTSAAVTHAAELGALATAHTTAPLSGPQVLDRLLWFDSEGLRHFAPKPARAD